jgi:aminopeptidase N
MIAQVYRLGIGAPLLLALAAELTYAQPPEPDPAPAGRIPPPGAYAPGFDVQHYALRITLPADGQRIDAIATIDIALVAPRRDTLRLDLSGLRVTSVRAGQRDGALQASPFRQADGRVFIPVPATVPAGDTLRVAIAYDGVPDDGLVIGRNVHGARTAFADNWPDRARFWFPSIDHPSDKATVEYEVHAPPGWEVVANGRLTSAPEGGANVWSFEVRVPIPTYTMVIGAADFAFDTIAACAPGGITALRADGCVAVTGLTFPQDSANGTRIFRRAGDMVRYYAERFAPFPYEKLAHVQSATRFGGMENVGAIFYSEEGIAQGRLSEVTVAHETVHQWFGDAVTPQDWAHLWLSEGFATYFGMLYFEEADGAERFRELLAQSALEYIRSDVTDLPIVDTARAPGADLFSWLNANSYNKGGQVLHMLRAELGDSAFFDGLRRYYAAHLHGTARTEDLRRALEAASGRELGWFFEQWVYRPGHPIFRVEHTYVPATREAVVTLTQVQKAVWPTFRVSFDVVVDTPAGEVRRRVEVTERAQTIRIPVTTAPTAVRLDPEGRVLKARMPVGRG